MCTECGNYVMQARDSGLLECNVGKGEAPENLFVLSQRMLGGAKKLPFENTWSLRE